MEFIEAACIEIGQNMKVGTFISLESTTYPTTTEEFMLPIIEKESGLIEGRDFWLAFSPERVDPGNKQYGTRNTPKVIGAISKEGLEIGSSFVSRSHAGLKTGQSVTEISQEMRKEESSEPVGDGHGHAHDE